MIEPRLKAAGAEALQETGQTFPAPVASLLEPEGTGGGGLRAANDDVQALRPAVLVKQSLVDPQQRLIPSKERCPV